MVVGRLLSCWEGHFSGAMLNFGRVVSNSKATIFLVASPNPHLVHCVAKKPLWHLSRRKPSTRNVLHRFGNPGCLLYVWPYTVGFKTWVYKKRNMRIPSLKKSDQSWNVMMEMLGDGNLKQTSRVFDWDPTISPIIDEPASLVSGVISHLNKSKNTPDLKYSFKYAGKIHSFRVYGKKI